MKFQDHPLVLCAITAGSTLTICIAVTSSWILPTLTKSIENRLEIKSNDLDDTLNDNKILRQKVKSLQVNIYEINEHTEKEIKSRDNIISELKLELFENQNSNLFMNGSPYPFGFDKLKIGDPINLIYKAYGYENISEIENIYKFKPYSDIFYSISLYNGINEKDIIEAIDFDIGFLRGFGENPKPDLPDDWIEKSLRRALGNPNAEIGPGNRCLVWAVDDGKKTLVFYRKGDTSYMVSFSLSPAGCFITKDQENEFASDGETEE